MEKESFKKKDYLKKIRGVVKNRLRILNIKNMIMRTTLSLKRDPLKPENQLFARIYSHNFGIMKSFSGQAELFGKDPFCNALVYAQHSLSGVVEQEGNRDFFIAFAWGDRGKKKLDVFGYSGLEEWPGNPEVDSWVVTNGVISRENPVLCGTGLIVLGREEEYRRSSKSLIEYIENPPTLPSSIVVNE